MYQDSRVPTKVRVGTWVVGSENRRGEGEWQIVKLTSQAKGNTVFTFY